MKAIIVLALIIGMAVYLFTSNMKGNKNDYPNGRKRKRISDSMAETMLINEMIIEVMDPDKDSVVEEIPLGQIPEKGLVIGRSRICDVVVGNPTVSRKHCLLKQDKEGLRLFDIGSMQGIFDGKDRKNRKKCMRIEQGKKYYLADVPVRIVSRNPVRWEAEEADVTRNATKKHKSVDFVSLDSEERPVTKVFSLRRRAQ